MRKNFEELLADSLINYFENAKLFYEVIQWYDRNNTDSMKVEFVSIRQTADVEYLFFLYRNEYMRKRGSGLQRITRAMKGIETYRNVDYRPFSITFKRTEVPYDHPMRKKERARMVYRAKQLIERKRYVSTEKK